MDNRAFKYGHHEDQTRLGFPIKELPLLKPYRGKRLLKK